MDSSLCTFVRALVFLLDATGIPSAVDSGQRGGAHRRAAPLRHRLGVAVAVRRCAVSEFGLVRHCRHFGTPGLLIHNKRTRTIALLVAGAVSLFLNAQVKHQQFPNGWTGEMTRIHRPRKADDVADLAIEEQLQQAAQSSGAKVLVFPEGAVRRWTDATEAFWAPVVADAGKTLLIGAVQPIPGSARYYNSVVIIGDHARPAFHQRIPVPGGMWNPFHPEGGVELNPLGPGTIDLGGQRAAILICYEQLLTWPMLRSAIEKPTVLVAISNESWTAATPVPRIQHACVRAWARLFGLPAISAINS